ncbi:MAG TPA: hypothetical protein VGK25_02095 [Ignavibacteria bacterium]|jgi:hypothetical protein
MEKMKAIYSLLILFIFGFYLSGCDSPTETKATGIKTPVLISPTDNSIDQPRSPTLKWTNEGTKLQIDVNGSFASPPYDFGVSGTTYTLPVVLDAQKDYYWRVGVTSGNQTYWSNPFFHFKTGN